MKLSIRAGISSLAIAGFALALALWPALAWAHCDTLDGPVVADARKALNSGDVTAVLKWVRPTEEAEIRAAFAKARAVRTLSPEARELADRHFFETVVRIHRQGEGAPYTGLKAVGSVTDPGILAADKALETGSASTLTKQMSESVAAGIEKRFLALQEKKKHADESVAKGREYVAAYAEFIHYVESLHKASAGPEKETGAGEGHKH